MFFLAAQLKKMSQLSPIGDHYRTELPVLIFLYWALSFVLKKGKLSAFIAAYPFVVIYVGFDIFYAAWGNVFKVIDCRNLPELLKVLPWMGKLGVLALIFLPIVLLLCFIDYRKYWRLLGMTAFAGLLVIAVEFRPGAVLYLLDHAGLRMTEWSDAECVNENGRLTMTLYSEARRRKALSETEGYRSRGDYYTRVTAAAEYIRRHGNNRNVYVVVLESWIDPTLLKGVTFSRDPRHPDFVRLVGDKQSFSISPVFGGQTAQAEFEVLCGVPALQRLSEIEFDDFTGKPAGCTPGVLAKAGYTSVVSNGFEPNYFNSTKAYTGVGFQQIYFPKEYGSAMSSYLTLGNTSQDETYMFDGDLFDQNLKFIANTLRDHPKQPLYSYVLGIYGHAPHDIDVARRPLIVSVTSGQKDDQLVRATNQYYYRTQAIARYVNGLIKVDPKSLIIIVSDHLPVLDKGMNSYKEYRYLNNVDDAAHLNRILIVENGKVVRHKTIHHYDVSSVIYDYLTSKRYCSENDCDESDTKGERDYLSLIAHAVGPID